MTSIQSKTISLKVGKSYKIRDTLTEVVPLFVIPSSDPSCPKRAIFVSDRFAPTPFIEYTYRIINHSTIDVENGTYFWSFESVANSLIERGYIEYWYATDNNTDENNE